MQVYNQTVMQKAKKSPLTNQMIII
uniref:Uncharacterized protein n=1 Tax=Rhizophora mucronata TaxID=61149 RepID=A0A2P2R1N4_RHIMU